MVDRLARVVAKLYGQAGRSISRPVSANPLADLRGKSARLKIAGRTCRFAMAKRCGWWAGHLSARAKAIGSDVPWGMPFANRLCPDENLLRQNASI
ncbi:hypothetical protein [Rhizobium binxianense]|uniref:hypothetical protein n=1 Tax=Rhizobium binxianense TaxID=3024242 RepID=UPI00234F4F6F|nr:MULTISPECIES: hypothetical protein [unclassified Rhizobium]MDC7743911.1 hypothetical protein [Rhizobium sp. BC56]MDC9833091.1 hypothetical protein [Rhizobium sp. MJ37]